MRRLAAVLFLSLAGACLSAWASDADVLQFSSELSLHESKQVLEPDRVFRYSQSTEGEALRRLLDPGRLGPVLDSYFERIKRGQNAPDLNMQLRPLLMRYQKAFAESPAAYESEYLDSLEWTVGVMKRSAVQSQAPRPQASPGPAANQPGAEAFAQLAQAAQGLLQTLLRLVQDDLRAQVARNLFSEQGARRALALAESLTPPAAPPAEVPPPPRTRPVQSGREVYAAQCSACHNTGFAFAPRLGDTAAWAGRLQQGLPALLQSILRGKTMAPHSGSGFTELELERAVVFLANAAGGRFTEPALPAGHPGHVVLPPPRPAMAPEASAATLGERTYVSNCVVCHQPNGRGVETAIPSLVNAPNLLKPQAIDVVLRGSGRASMPAMSRLSDEEIAAVLNYMRGRFSSTPAVPIDASDVRNRR